MEVDVEKLARAILKNFFNVAFDDYRECPRLPSFCEVVYSDSLGGKRIQGSKPDILELVSKTLEEASVEDSVSSDFEEYRDQSQKIIKSLDELNKAYDRVLSLLMKNWRFTPSESPKMIQVRIGEESFDEFISSFVDLTRKKAEL